MVIRSVSVNRVYNVFTVLSVSSVSKGYRVVRVVGAGETGHPDLTPDKSKVLTDQKDRRRRRLKGSLGASRGDGWRRTDVEDQLLASLNRYGAATQRQIADRFYGGVLETTRRRLRFMRETGLLRTNSDERWAGVVAWPSPKGASLSNVGLSAPQWPGERLLHKLAVTDTAFRFEKSNLHIISEREMRMVERGTYQEAAAYVEQLGLGNVNSVRDANGRPRFFASPVGEKNEVHFPDLILIHPSLGMVAVEVEITPKAPAALRRILHSYQQSRLFNQVMWLTTEPVRAGLEGFHDSHTSSWVDGAMHTVGIYRSGEVPKNAAGDAYRVAPMKALDEGVRYQLDMKQIPDHWRCSMDDWRQIRDRWSKDTQAGEKADVEFIPWWYDQVRQGSRLPAPAVR